MKDMEVEDYINEKIEMLESGFSLEQVRKETWEHIHKTYINMCNLEKMIDLSMELYSEIIKRYTYRKY